MPGTITSPESLVADFQHGRSSALESVYKLHYHALFAAAQRILQDDAAADDVIAKSFIKLWERRASFSNLRAIAGFLYTVTRNECLTIIKKEKRTALAHTEYAYLSETVESLEDADQVGAELIQLAFFQVANMPDQMRQVFILLYQEGFSIPEVAKELDLSVNTVRTQQQRALKRVRTAFQQEGWLKTIGLLEFMLHPILGAGATQ